LADELADAVEEKSIPGVTVYAYWDEDPDVDVQREQPQPYVSVNAGVAVPLGVKSKVRSLPITILIATHPKDDPKAKTIHAIYKAVRAALDALEPSADLTGCKTTEFLITGGSRGIDEKGAFITITGTLGAVLT
jgi:hypothetical protein